jgi:hypothetical protein
VVSVAENESVTDLSKLPGRHRLDGRLRPDGHEDRRLDGGVREDKRSASCMAFRAGCVDSELYALTPRWRRSIFIIPDGGANIWPPKPHRSNVRITYMKKSRVLHAPQATSHRTGNATVLAVVAAVALIAFLSVFTSSGYRRYNTALDVEGQQLLYSYGVVDGVTYRNSIDAAPTPTFYVKVKDQRVRYRTALNLQPGQKLTVSYRVGKSGNIHIEGLEPLK